MKCSICKSDEVIKLPDYNQIKFICKNGHSWYEDYTDNGGSHKRPSSYEIKLEDTLFPSEKIIYSKILNQIENNINFYKTANPLEKTKELVNNCNTNEKEIYSLLKKIDNFNRRKEL